MGYHHDSLFVDYHRLFQEYGVRGHGHTPAHQGHAEGTAILQGTFQEDSTFLENLKQDWFLEKYARETFYMKGRGEEIYLLEE